VIGPPIGHAHRAIGGRGAIALVVCAALGCTDADGVAGGRSLLRPTDSGEPAPRFAAGEAVESVVSPGGSFRIHYSESGPNAVRALDGDGDGIPDGVEEVARTYDEAHDFYADELGMRTPVSDEIVTDGDGGDALFDVYLVDFGGRGDGAYRGEACTAEGTCAGYMIQENDFAGYPYPSLAAGTRIVGSHELFHAVQAAYAMDEGVTVSEATAVWATEQFDPSLHDFEGFVAGYLERTDRSLAIDPTGPVPPFAYGAAIFFQFLTERYDRDLVRAMWERLAGSDVHWLEAIDAELRDRSASSIDEALLDFARWNVRTDTRADATVSYASGAFYVAIVPGSITAGSEPTAMRLAPASARYFAVPLGGGLSFALDVDAAFEPGQLKLLAFTVDGSNVTEVAALDPNTIGSATGAGDLWVALVNARPDLAAVSGRACIGSEAFVTSCIGTETMPDAGAGDGGSSGSDGGSSGTDAGTPPEPGDDGCGCRASPNDACFPIAMLALFAIARRRRFATGVPRTSS
jgi:MYXO-CTERM domain-containing protein